MPNRGGAEGGTPELYLTDPDGLAIQLQDVTYCGGGGFLGDVCPANPVLTPAETRIHAHTIPRPAPRRALAGARRRARRSCRPTSTPRRYSRLPPLDRAALDEEGKKIWDYVGGARGMPPTGPAPVSMYSPGAAKPIHELNQYLRKTVVGPRFFELSALDRRARVRSAVRVVGARAGRDGAPGWSRA